MGKEIVINAEKDQTRIAIVENGDLVELYFETPENERTIGDIYLGRIRKVMPSIQAAFVDIGQKQDAFLHFSDLTENLEDWLNFVDQPTPQVSKFKAHRHRPMGRRRHARPTSAEGAPAEIEAVGKPVRPDARKRGARRSAQRRAKQQQKGGAAARQAEHERRRRRPPAEQLLQRDQRILVKIVKEPISNKGSRVSTDISLAGRFLVLVPLADYAAVSKKITSPKERRRLRALAKSLLPDGFGVIVRTVAAGRDAKTLDIDLRLLLDKWRKIEKNLASLSEPPSKVHEDVSMASSIIRDLFSDDYDRILIDHPRMYRNVKNYVHAIAPQMEKAVQQHQGDKPIFQAVKLDREVAQVFESRLDLPSGGYLFLERTEAMHVVDVNSGRSGRGMTQEQNSLRVNLEAARVIAKQIRLRDLGGIIVIDFIDLRDERNRRKVHDELKKCFRLDRAVTKVLPMSDFGLVQITRQRLRPSITTTFSGPQPTANGTPGKKVDMAEKAEAADSEPVPELRHKQKDDRPKQKKREPRGERGNKDERGKGRGRLRPPKRTPEELVVEIEQWIVAYRASGKRGSVTLRVHPFTAAYLNRKVPTLPTRWFMKHLVRVRVEPDPQMPPMVYRFSDPVSGDDVTGDFSAKPSAASDASPA